jgi:hypothetical protein
MPPPIGEEQAAHRSMPQPIGEEQAAHRSMPQPIHLKARSAPAVRASTQVTNACSVSLALEHAHFEAFVMARKKLSMRWRMEDRKRSGFRRRTYLGSGVVLLVVGAAALVHAAVPHAFVTNETLTADSLNSNFAALDARTAALETSAAAAPPVLESASDVNQTGSTTADLVYTSASLTFASVSTNVAEGVELGLYDVTNGADIPNARGGIAVTVPPYLAVALQTAKVLSVASPTAIQMKAYRNGVSTLTFGYANALAGGRNRMMAVRLK